MIFCGVLLRGKAFPIKKKFNDDGDGTMISLFN